MRILLVEDNSDHRELMRLALTGHDSTWEVEAVASGEEALRFLLGGEVFDLVFLDYSLPERDGLEVLEEIRRGEAPPPVVVVTGRGDEQVAVKALKGGAYDYVMKQNGYLERLPVVARRAVEAHQLSVERKRAEEALKESESKYRNLIDQAWDAIFVIDSTGKMLLVNEQACQTLGYTQEELIRLNVADTYPVEERAIAAQRITMVQRGDHLRYERSMMRKDGTIFPVEVAIGMLPNGMIQGIVRNITSRKRAEEALLESEARYRQLVEYAPTAIYEVDLTTGRLISVNEVLCEYSGYTRDELLALNPLDLMTEESQKLVLQRMAGYAAGEPVPPTVEYKARSKSGREFWISVNAKYFYQAGLAVRATVVAYDITERKQTEEEVQASREQMRALAGRLQAVREEERTNIAREIHDELGGALTGLKIDFSLLTRAALKIENKTVRTSLLAGMDSMIESVDATIHTVRRIAMELRPGVLDDLGLVAALEWQLKDFEKRTGIRCEFFPPVEDISLDTDLSTALFRIFQEALTNVVHHSGAAEVCVRLRTDADSSTLEVEDNGKGIKEKNILSSKSLGLLGMRERAQMFGGRITVTGTPGRGTKVTVEIPSVEKRKMDRDQEGADG